jgi:PEP-CTERM motif
MGWIPSSRLGWWASAMGIAACWLLSAPLLAHAGPLDLTTTSPGDLTTFSLDVEYNHTTGVLTADATGDGFTSSLLDDNVGFYPITYAVTATLDPTSGDLISGTIAIGSPDLDSGLLISGNITAFGFPDPTDATNVPLEFQFQVTGGALTDFGQTWSGATSGGMIVHMISTDAFFTGAWPTTDFGSQTSDNALNSTSDTFPMTFASTPEPSTLVLLASGLFPLAWRLRRRGQKPA